MFPLSARAEKGFEILIEFPGNFLCWQFGEGVDSKDEWSRLWVVSVFSTEDAAYVSAEMEDMVWEIAGVKK